MDVVSVVMTGNERDYSVVMTCVMNYRVDLTGDGIDSMTAEFWLRLEADIIMTTSKQTQQFERVAMKTKLLYCFLKLIAEPSEV